MELAQKSSIGKTEINIDSKKYNDKYYEKTTCRL